MSAHRPLGISDQVRPATDYLGVLPGHWAYLTSLGPLFGVPGAKMPLTAVAVGLHSQHRPRVYINVAVGHFIASMGHLRELIYVLCSH